MRHALRLAVEVGRLRRQVRLLRGDLLLSRAETAQAQEALRKLTRDADLVALMARDPKVACEFLRDVHRIDGLGEAS